MRNLWVVLGVLAAVLSACGDDAAEDRPGDAAAPREATKVRVGTFAGTGTGNWTSGVAKALGYFEDEGLDVELTYTYDGGALLVGGQLDVISDGADAGVIARAQGADVIAIAPVVMLAADGLVVQRSITGVEGLAGKKIRVTTNGTDEFLAWSFIKANGLSPEEIEWVSIDEDGPAIAQMEAGRLDGGMFDQSMVRAAEEDGTYQVLAYPADFGTFPWNVLQTTRAFAKDNRDAMVGYVRAIRRAIEFITDPDNGEEVIDALVEVQEGIEREDVANSYELVKGTGFDMFSLDPLRPEDVRPVIDQLLHFGFGEGKVEDVDLDAFIDNSFADEAAGR